MGKKVLQQSIWQRAEKTGRFSGGQEYQQLS